jgi:hypothetical protein
VFLWAKVAEDFLEMKETTIPNVYHNSSLELKACKIKQILIVFLETENEIEQYLPSSQFSGLR